MSPDEFRCSDCLEKHKRGVAHFLGNVPLCPGCYAARRAGNESIQETFSGP